VQIIPQPGIAAQPSLLSSVNSDIGNAISVPNLPSDALSAFQSAQTAAAQVQVLTLGASAVLGLQNATQAASTVASTGAAAADVALGAQILAASSANQVTPGTDAMTAAVAFLVMQAAATASASYHEASVYAGRITANLSNASA
jgi:hypothetical protein